jgi:hypothetical protein
MNDDHYLDDLERFLAHAAILETADPQLGGAHGQKRLVSLEGGLRALAKPATGIGEGNRVVVREVAAWVFARELGLASMLACTVLREDVPLQGGAVGLASVQVIWPPPFTPDLAGDFSEREKIQAAVLDVVIGNADRGGHNWLAFDDPDRPGSHRLGLVDHGYAFGLQGQLNSTFYNDCQGSAIEEPLLTGLRRCCLPRQERQLETLFVDERGELQNALARVEALAANATL